MTASTFGLVALPAVWLGLVMAAAPHAAQARSVLDGVYSEAQAKRGLDAYRKDCASCHGEGLDGDGAAPGLAGSEFLSSWNGTTVGDLYERVRQSMPPGNPGALPAKVKGDIVAYLLQMSTFPAGEADLPADGNVLKAIKFELPK